MKLPETLFFSRYSHAISKNGNVAFYHSLKFRPIFIESILAEKLKYFKNKADTFSFFNKKENEDLHSLVETLVDHGILISDKKQDENTINYFRDNIPEPLVYVAFFILTDACNFNCDYCFIEHDRKKNKFKEKYMSKEVALKALDFYVDQTLKDPSQFEERKAIQFYGGEPLMNFKVLKALLPKINLYQEQKKLTKNLELTVVTNGSLLTEEVVLFLKRFNVGITISIDGDDIATAHRQDHSGNAVYSRIIKGIQNCKKHSAHFALSVTLTEETIRSADDTLKTIQEIQPNRIGFNMLQGGEHFSLEPDYAQRASDFILNAFNALREKGIIYEDNFIRKAESFASASVCVSDCGAVAGNQIIIAPDGEVGLCEGFIGERKFFVSDISNKQFDLKDEALSEEWGKRKPLLMEQCQDCVAIGICGGGCLVGPYKNADTIWKLDENNCIHMKNSTEWLIWDLYDNITKS